MVPFLETGSFFKWSIFWLRASPELSTIVVPTKRSDFSECGGVYPNKTSRVIFDQMSFQKVLSNSFDVKQNPKGPMCAPQRPLRPFVPRKIIPSKCKSKSQSKHFQVASFVTNRGVSGCNVKITSGGGNPFQNVWLWLLWCRVVFVLNSTILILWKTQRPRVNNFEIIMRVVWATKRPVVPQG